MVKNLVWFSCVMILGVGLANNSFAAPAAPIETVITQPDGTQFISKAAGDEYAAWIETKGGHSIVLGGDGFWYYAELTPDGVLTSNGTRVGAATLGQLLTMPRHLSPTPTEPFEVNAPNKRLIPGTKGAPVTQDVVTILVEFSDTAFTYSDATLEALMYGATNSVKEYYLEASYNNFTISPAAETEGTIDDGIIHVVLGTAHPDLGASFSGWRPTASAVLSAADVDIDYSSFDDNADGTITVDELSVVMILAGYEASYGSSPSTPNVWGHKTSLNSALTLDGVDLQPYTMFGERHGGHVATIGIMCHELGHLMLGLPDLYDTNGGSEGIGEWGLMGSGSWNKTGSFSGDSPAHLTAWSKAQVGFMTPTDINSAVTGSSLTNADASADAKRLWIDQYRSPIGEYFMIENRQLSGYDAGLPGDGLIIYHVDGSKTSNSDETAKWVDVEEADGLAHLDSETNRGDTGDPFPGSSSNTTFNDASNPNSKDQSGTATNISVSSISASANVMTADYTPISGGLGETIYYDENLYTGNSRGYSTAIAWTALRITNTSSEDMIEGFEVYTRDATTVDFHWYSSIPSGIPTGLIHSETGFAASAGWNRFMLATPQSFPTSSDRVMVLKIDSPGENFPAYYDGDQDGSERSYIDASGVGAFFQYPASQGVDWNQHVLLKSADPAPTADTITPITGSPTASSTIQFTVEFSEDVFNFDAESDLVIGQTGSVAHTGVAFAGGDTTWTVSVTGVTGEGTMNLAVATDSDVEDSVSNGLASSVTSSSVTIDRVAPLATSITRSNPTAETTAASQVIFAVEFDESVSGVATNNFSIDATGDQTTATVDSIGGAGTSWTVTVNTVAGTGTLSIDLDSNLSSIVDGLGNGMSTSFTAGASYIINREAPTIDSITPVETITTESTVSFIVTFAEDVQNFDAAADVTIGVTGTLANTGVTISGGPAIYTVDVTGVTGGGTMTLAVDTGSDVEDLFGNALAASPTSSAVNVDTDGSTSYLHYVDFAWGGSEDGAIATPYNTFAEAQANLTAGGTIRIKGDTADSDSSEVLSINKAMTLEAVGGTVSIGAP